MKKLRLKEMEERTRWKRKRGRNSEMGKRHGLKRLERDRARSTSWVRDSRAEGPQLGTERYQGAYRAHTRVLDIHPHGVSHHLPLAVGVNQRVVGHQAEGRNEIRCDGQGQNHQVLAGLSVLASHLQQLPLVHDLGGRFGIRIRKVSGRMSGSGEGGVWDG